MEADEEETIPLKHVLLLEVDGRRVGLPIEAVREVLPAAEVEPAPHQPSFVEGVLNVRGEVLPVLSLRERLGVPSREARIDDHLLLIDTGDRQLLLRADRALDLVGIDPARVRPLEPPRRPFSGAIATEDGVLLVQDARLFLDEDEASALTEA